MVLKRRSQHQAAALSAAAAAAAAAAAQHHDFGYSHDFSPKASPAVPTYKWMQVKRNVPKPGKEAVSESFVIQCKSKKLKQKAPTNVTWVRCVFTLTTF